MPEEPPHGSQDYRGEWVWRRNQQQERIASSMPRELWSSEELLEAFNCVPSLVDERGERLPPALPYSSVDARNSFLSQFDDSPELRAYNSMTRMVNNQLVPSAPLSKERYEKIREALQQFHIIALNEGQDQASKFFYDFLYNYHAEA